MKRLRFVLTTSPRVHPKFKRCPDALVSFAPMDALADGLGGLGELETRAFFEVSSGSYNYFENGDVLLAKVTPCFENGKKAIARNLENGAGFATSEVLVFRPKSDGVDTRYLRYLFCSEDFRHTAISSMTGAGGLRRVSERAVLDFLLPISNLLAQRAIADFLDRETARIDLLIEKKQRLVALLGEKRSATITAAVIGQTGVEGAGSRDSPCVEGGDGARLQLRRVVSLVNTKTQFDESLRPYIGLEHIASWTGEIMGSDDAEPEGLVAHFSQGDVLFGKLRPYLAKVASPAFKGVCSTEVLVLRPGKRVERRFLRYTLASSGFIDRVNAATYGAKMPRANWENIGTENIWSPDLPTQRAIADFLDQETARLEQIQETTQQSIERLKEYRSALITAAVTGQIDVSNYAKSGTSDRQLDAIQSEFAE